MENTYFGNEQQCNATNMRVYVYSNIFGLYVIIVLFYQLS